MPPEQKSSLAVRLDRLRAVTGKTWDALARDLGVQKAMVFHARSGRRGFSDRTLARLSACEVAAGLRSEASLRIEQGLRGSDLVEALLRADRPAQGYVTVDDIDARKKRVPLEYRRGSVPTGYPAQITVTSPRNSTVWRIIGEKGSSEDPSRFLAACLPDLVDKPDVLDRLSPSCYTAILETALELTFGLNWRAKLEPKSKQDKRHQR